ncbi:3-hydroxyacyl-ACP dehydratase [Salicibibacter cibarius]|uniref:3-hydroxyacyl-ACP dehydratase n=1 Tax=Salicibibacter cibarius TaxID=2743000 RepID=A0A7T7CBX9_9BACI|nr:MaoC/PaaZ C-terminal domain-containing protein [Salicibibacter cibarius]QQK76424.1 3-hydroxyacyl-ACP dehydratase [Salicibibacter cibarius]
MFYEDIEVGEQLPVIEKDPITRVQLVKYAGASGDFNPLHTDEDVGEQAGTGLIAHGMLIMGMAAEGVTTWMPRKNVKKFNVRFQKMTYPGDKIRVEGSILEKKDDHRVVGEVQAVNQDGEVKVKGKFECELPAK